MSVMLALMHRLRHGAILVLMLLLILLVDMNRYLHEVVQKAMTVTNDVHRHKDQNVRDTNGRKPNNGTNGANGLLAAYEVCHDLCCGMVLQILHAQAVKLASRVRGLWATQLVAIFHKESQVCLYLCLLMSSAVNSSEVKAVAPSAELSALGQTMQHAMQECESATDFAYVCHLNFTYT